MPSFQDMSDVLVLHGKPSREAYEDPAQPPVNERGWFPWLKTQLEAQGRDVAIPLLPAPYAPDYEAWGQVFDKQEVTACTDVVAFSAGAGLLLRKLTEQNHLSISKAVLVAPWIDPNHRYGDVFDFAIDPAIAFQCAEITVFHSSLDGDEPRRSLEVIRSALPHATCRDIPSYGHFQVGNTMPSEEFPELIEELAQ